MATFTLDTNTPSMSFQFDTELVKITSTGTFDGCQLLVEYYNFEIGRWLLVPSGGISTAAVTDLVIQNPSNRMRVRVHNSDGGLEDVDVTLAAITVDTGLDYA